MSQSARLARIHARVVAEIAAYPFAYAHRQRRGAQPVKHPARRTPPPPAANLASPSGDDAPFDLVRETRDGLLILLMIAITLVGLWIITP